MDELPIVIAGPTASGKSTLALALAEALDGTVINADSMQVYAELRVITARPSAADEARAPHRLYGTLSARERCSAGVWRRLALAAIAEASAAGRRPILVGGTGLYIRALLHGIAEIPPVPPEIRARSQALHAELGGDAFRTRLGELDPASAARIRVNDAQRLTRAYEIVLATGRPMGEFLARDPAAGMAARVILLDPPLDELIVSITTRCMAMLGSGAIDEVAALMAMELDPSLPAMKAVGVPLLVRHLRGEVDTAEILTFFVRETRQYARRQRTWFRTMSGAEVVLRALKDQGVEVIFGYPGGAVLPIYDALFQQNAIRHILVRHEQARCMPPKAMRAPPARWAWCW
jgi:tRNA dimethylallyltransferase